MRIDRGVLAIAVLIGALVIGSVALLQRTLDSKGADWEHVCTYDDMLPLELKVDRLGHTAGEIVCMHIDEYNDHPGKVRPGEHLHDEGN